MIQLYSAQDFITNLKQKENQDTIQPDGYFEMSFQSLYTQPVFFRIENVVAQMYVQPDFVYGITIPELEKDFNYNNDADLPLNIGVIGNDSTELNALTFDYQEQYNSYFTMQDGEKSSSPAVFRPGMFKRADSLQKNCYSRYAKIENDYFRSYVIYSIASINASVSRGETYLINSYITNRPIQYNHYEYMQFFDACFKGYLNSIASRQKGPSLYNIINSRADYPSLLNFVRQDKLLRNDTIRELVILKNLWDFYFSADFVPEAVENIVSQINVETKIKQHKKIASNMLAYFNKMQVGSMAPGFSALGRDLKSINLSSFKGRWVYLNFFSTTNIESLKELPKIASLKKKFGDKIVFLSVCLDDSIRTYQSFLRTNPKYDWPIWFNKETGSLKTAKESYYVTGTEAYFLINNQGYLASSPALSPSQGIEYKLNVIFRIKQKTTKTGIR